MADEVADDIQQGGRESVALSLCGVAEGTPEAALVTGVYMPLARAAILRARNPYAADPEAVGWESRYDLLQCEIAADMFARRGAEGELTHNENGVSRTWGSAGVSKHLMARVVPRGAVPGA